MSGLLGTGPSVEKYTEVIPLPGGDADVFINAHPPWEPGEASHSVFGGFLLAHSVASAHATVAADLAAHSVQGVFVLPARADVPLHYHVERIADGRNFATRIVRLRQGGRVVFVATVGLQKQAPAAAQESVRSGAGTPAADVVQAKDGAYAYHQYGPRMPDVGDVDPETLSRDRNQILLDMGYPQAAIDTSAADPFDWRPLSMTHGDSRRVTGRRPAKQSGDDEEREEEEEEEEAKTAGTEEGTLEDKPREPSTFGILSFVRAVHPWQHDDSPAAHLRALAFLTDEFMVGHATLANRRALRKRGRPRLKMQASVNHTVLFHDATARADAWMVSEISTSWADHGRVLVQQRLWDWRTGRIVLTCWQEGVVRLSGGSSQL